MKIDPAGAKRLLVVKPSSLGDVVHTLPAVAALHAAHPEIELHWIANTEWAPLLQGHPALSSVIPFPRRELRGWRDLPRAKAWTRENLAPLAPDIALDFQGLLRSALLARGARARQIVGFRQAREGAPFFYDHKVDVSDWKNLHAVDRYLRLVEALGGPRPATPQFDLPSGDPVENADLPEKFVLFHPFSRGKGKSFSAPEVVAFCERIAPETTVVIVGAGAEWPAQVGLPPGVVNLLDGTSLSQLIWLMRRASWIVSVDSGPMHLAAAITPNLLSIHTWTDPLMVGPFRPDAWIWRDRNLLPIREIEPGQFPEQRGERGKFEPTLLPPSETERVADFVKSQLESPGD